MNVYYTPRGPIEELREALHHPPAALLGAAVGGVVPFATFVEAHYGAMLGSAVGGRLLSALGVDPGLAKSVLVCAGLLFSAKTVWKWGYVAFEDGWKATGFVLLLEGVMVFGSFEWLSRIALGYLIGINAIATGCRFALRDKADRERAAAARAAALLAHSAMSELPRGQATRPSEEVSNLWAPEESTSEPLESEETAPERPTGIRASDAELYERAIQHIVEKGTCSISGLQRELGVGYNKAARLVEHLEGEGVIGPAPGRAGAGRRVLLALPASRRTPNSEPNCSSELAVTQG